MKKITTGKTMLLGAFLVLFLEKFPPCGCMSRCRDVDATVDELWDFISTALKEARKEERKLLSSRIMKVIPKKLKDISIDNVHLNPEEYWVWIANRHGFNQALCEVKDALKKELGK